MKVYVITKGCYSEYHICAVTTNPMDAKRLKVKCSDRYEDAEIEEYDTEKYNEVLENKTLYLVEFEKSGNVKRIYAPESIDYYLNEDRVEYFRNDVLQVKVFAQDETSAVKIASEIRAIELARKHGIS